MKRLPKQNYTLEFKQEAVRRLIACHGTVALLATRVKAQAALRGACRWCAGRGRILGGRSGHEGQWGSRFGN